MAEKEEAAPKAAKGKPPVVHSSKDRARQDKLAAIASKPGKDQKDYETSDAAQQAIAEAAEKGIGLAVVEIIKERNRHGLVVRGAKSIYRVGPDPELAEELAEEA